MKTSGLLFEASVRASVSKRVYIDARSWCGDSAWKIPTALQRHRGAV